MTSTLLVSELIEAARAGTDVKRIIREGGGAPLQDGRATTFVWVGPAERVGLHHWMDVFPKVTEFNRQPDTDLWTLTMKIPDESRIEYKLAIRRDDRRRLILDPLNPNRARDPFGTNSVVTGPQYQRPIWSIPSPKANPGDIEYFEVESEAFGDTRSVGLYLPSKLPDRPLPLLLAHDGSEYVEFAALAIVLDNLIAAGEIPPIAVALTDPGRRNVEYTGYQPHADHMVREVIPAIAERAPVDRSRVIALGASLGGVASLHASWAHAGVFHGLILQSGSFVRELGGRHRRGEVFEPVTRFLDRFFDDPGELPSTMHVSCGQFDGLAADNRVFVRQLQSLGGSDLVYEEVPDGHNWENWRDRLRAGLIHVLTN